MRLGQHPLDHQGVYVNKAGLQKVQRQHRHILVFQQVSCNVPAFTKKDKAISAVPVLNDIQPFVNFTP